MQRKICHACGRQLNAYDHFCDGCGASQAKSQLDDVEAIAAEFLLNKLKASSVDVLGTRPNPDSDHSRVVCCLVEDGDGLLTNFEVKVDPLTKKVVTWNMLF